MAKLIENELPKIRIVLRDDKPVNVHKENTFNFYIRFQGKTFKKPSGLYINPSNWNKKKNQIINHNPKDARCALKLKEKVADFEKYFLTYDARGAKITITAIDDYFEDKRYDDFFSFYIVNLKQKERELGPATLFKYNLTYEILRAYCKKKKIDKLPFIDIDLNFLLNFDKFLIFEKKLTSDTANNYHKNLKTTLSDAVVRGIINRSPYLGFKPYKTDSKVDRIPLTEKEIEAFENVIIPDDKAYLTRAKDYFIFMLNTGLRFSDFIALKATDIKFGAIDIKQIKTRGKVYVPLNKKARWIMHKYASAERGFLFPQIENQVINRNLKEIAILAGINKKIHTHLGRHSFATKLRKHGVSGDYIKELLGHKDIKTTNIYAKYDREKLISIINEL